MDSFSILFNHLSKLRPLFWVSGGLERFGPGSGWEWKVALDSCRFEPSVYFSRGTLPQKKGKRALLNNLVLVLPQKRNGKRALLGDLDLGAALNSRARERQCSSRSFSSGAAWRGELQLPRRDFHVAAGRKKRKHETLGLVRNMDQDLRLFQWFHFDLSTPIRVFGGFRRERCGTHVR